MVGRQAECFAYHHLRSRHGDAVVTPSSWISSAKLFYMPDSPNVDDAAGCDFRFRTPDGMTHLVEVKGHSTLVMSFSLTANELELAEQTRSATDRRFYVLLVALQPQPRVYWELQDVCSLRQRGELSFTPESWLVKIQINAPSRTPAATFGSRAAAPSLADNIHALLLANGGCCSADALRRLARKQKLPIPGIMPNFLQLLQGHPQHVRVHIPDSFCLIFF